MLTSSPCSVNSLRSALRISSGVPFAINEPTPKNSSVNFLGSTPATPLSQVSISRSNNVVVGEVDARRIDKIGFCNNPNHFATGMFDDREQILIHCSQAFAQAGNGFRRADR